MRHLTGFCTASTISPACSWRKETTSMCSTPQPTGGTTPPPQTRLPLNLRSSNPSQRTRCKSDPCINRGFVFLTARQRNAPSDFFSPFILSFGLAERSLIHGSYTFLGLGRKQFKSWASCIGSLCTILLACTIFCIQELHGRNKTDLFFFLSSICATACCLYYVTF